MSDKKSIFNLPIEYANLDFDLLESAFIDFFKNNPESPFKDYRHNAAGMKNMRKFIVYMLHYLNFYLNVAVSENYLSKAVLEDSVYKLIHNFNFIPFGKTPARAFSEIKLYRGRTNLTRLSVASGVATTYTLNETILNNVPPTSATKSGELLIIDTVNDYLYIDQTLGGSFIPGTDNAVGSISFSFSAISSVALLEDYYETDDSDTFNVKFTFANYDSGDYIVPTIRDVYQEDEYINSVLDIYNENKALLTLEPYIDTTLNRRYLRAMIPIMQANWRTLEINNISAYTNPDGTQYIYLTLDGLKDINSDYKDAVLTDTIRVYILPSGLSNWSTESIELKNLDSQPLSTNLDHYKLKYDQDYGLYLKFNISNFSRQLVVGDKLRIIFATTKGDDINDIEGTTTFSSSSNNMSSIGYIQINDSSGTILYEIEDGVVAVGSNTYSEDGVTYDGISLRIVDDSNNDTFLINGQGKQDLDSIKEIAPLYYNSQGRAVNIDDVYALLKAKFTEFKDFAVWGGETEFLDLNEILSDIYTDLGGISSLNSLKTAFKQANYQANKYGLLAVESISDSDMTSGSYKPDLGHIYYSIVGKFFDFETQASTFEMIKSFIDGRKINTIFLRQMNPTYLLMKINLILKLNKSYTNNINVSDLKQRIREYINDKINFAKRTFNIEDLKSTIQDYDEISKVISMSITYDVKIKPTPVANVYSPSIDEFTYLRVFNQLSGDIGGSTTFNAIDNNGLEYKFYSDSTSTPVIKIGYSIFTFSQSDWYYNKSLGMMRFVYNFNGADYVYIRNIPIKNVNNQILSNKECILGIEHVDDISIVLT